MIARTVQPHDREGWLRLRGLLWPGHDDHTADIDAFFHLHPAGTEVFVLENDASGVIGFLEIGTRHYAEGCLSSPVAHIEGWYVEEPHRGQDGGRLLMEAAANWARKQDYHELASDCTITNSASAAAHQALGFEETTRIICFRRPL